MCYLFILGPAFGRDLTSQGLNEIIVTFWTTAEELGEICKLWDDVDGTDTSTSEIVVEAEAVGRKVNSRGVLGNNGVAGKDGKPTYGGVTNGNSLSIFCR